MAAKKDKAQRVEDWSHEKATDKLCARGHVEMPIAWHLWGMKPPSESEDKRG